MVYYSLLQGLSTALFELVWLCLCMLGLGWWVFGCTTLGTSSSTCLGIFFLGTYFIYRVCPVRLCIHDIGKDSYRWLL